MGKRTTRRVCRRNGLRRLGKRIDLDPVVSHARLDLFIVQVGDDQVGILYRHMAVDAVLPGFGAQFGEFAAVFVLVAL